ncbi:hypothetical protein GCM10010169_46390 [Micromonospora fulviviridis]|nr:hypothetical protein GCM10010169_46390 [Micromonospora fulviviridis]
MRDPPDGTYEPLCTVPSESWVYLTPCTCSETPSGWVGLVRSAAKVASGTWLCRVMARHSPSVISMSGPGYEAVCGVRP